jgi:hypothetical protein
VEISSGHETLRLGKPSPRAFQDLTKTKPPSASRGEGKELKVKTEIETQVDRGVAEQGISFFIILKLQVRRVHSFILTQIF